MTESSVSRRHSGRIADDHRLVLGVDGGGTKTVAWLARCVFSADPEVIGHGVADSSNFRAVGQSTASANLDAAIDAAWGEAQLKCRSVECAVLALAGAASSDVQDQVSAWAAQRSLTKRLKIVHDAKAVLEAGTAEGLGVALVAGTGSVAFGQDPGLATAVSGGWGYWFGDEGGAFGLGQAALRAAAQSVDDRAPKTRLLQAISNRLGIEEPREMLSALSVAGDIRQAIAELADLVTDVAQEQDPVACHIVEQAGYDLAGLVKSVANKLSLGSDFSLALAGGVMCSSPVIRESFLQSLHCENLRPTSVQLVKEPVSGCVKIACAAL